MQTRKSWWARSASAVAVASIPLVSLTVARGETVQEPLQTKPVPKVTIENVSIGAEKCSWTATATGKNNEPTSMEIRTDSYLLTSTGAQRLPATGSASTIQAKGTWTSSRQVFPLPGEKLVVRLLGRTGPTQPFALLQTMTQTAPLPPTPVIKAGFYPCASFMDPTCRPNERNLLVTAHDVPVAIPSGDLRAKICVFAVEPNKLAKWTCWEGKNQHDIRPVNIPDCNAIGWSERVGAGMKYRATVTWVRTGAELVRAAYDNAQKAPLPPPQPKETD